MKKCGAALTPLHREAPQKLSDNENKVHSSTQIHRYHQEIGDYLLRLGNSTRPGIFEADLQVPRHMSRFTVVHLTAARRVFMCLKRTEGLGLRCLKGAEETLDHMVCGHYRGGGCSLGE